MIYMVSKNQLKLIKSLHQKKYRNQHQLFFVEGIKTVKELLNSNFEPYQILTTAQAALKSEMKDTLEITDSDLKKISALHTPSGVLGVFKIPIPTKIDFEDWVLVLDDVRDPGNLGTVIRLCDWFGIKNLVCSKGTVDCFNPKVLQATMGSITRVNIVYENLESFISKSELPIYGAFMDGETVYQEELSQPGILIMGNEANGISKEIEKRVDKKIGIPQFGQANTESLNIATATAILLNEIRRG